MFNVQPSTTVILLKYTEDVKGSLYSSEIENLHTLGERGCVCLLFLFSTIKGVANNHHPNSVTQSICQLDLRSARPILAAKQ